MSRSRNQNQLELGPMEVRNADAGRVVVRKTDEAVGAFGFSEEKPLARGESAQALSAEIFDESLRTTRIGKVIGLERKEVAALLGVSKNLVDRWCNPNEPHCPSDVQMLCMPWAFHLARHRIMSKRFGFWRSAIATVMQSIGEVALGCE